MNDNARKLAEVMVISPDAAELEAMLARELATLRAADDPMAQAIARLYATGYRRNQIEWRQGETGEVLIRALPVLITQDLCETVLSIAGTDDNHAHRIAGAIMLDVIDNLPTAVETGLAARRIRTRGDG